MTYFTGPLNAPSPVLASGGAPGNPTLIQHVSTTCDAVLGSGNNYVLTIPSPIGAGNCLVLGVSAPHAITRTISDNINGTWPAASVVQDAGVGNNLLAVYVLPNAGAGVTTLTFAGSSNWVPFQATLSEFNNLALSSPANGSHGAALSGPNLAAGSFTPTVNNDVNGGNVIWAYYGLSSTATGNPTLWTPGGSFNLLHGDIAWNTNQGYPCASQWFLQATSAAINPSITATGDTTGYNAVALALKANNAGTGTAIPAGIHIDKVTHNASVTTGNLKLQTPTTGNLRILLITGYITITEITDSEGGTLSGGTWVRLAGVTNGIDGYYSQNKSANPNLTFTMSISGVGSPFCGRFYDVSGAAASAFDLSAAVPSTAAPGASKADIPDITPMTANGLVLACMATGIGPCNGVTAPAGVIDDGVQYTGLTNSDIYNNGDRYGHIYNTSTVLESWTWTLTSNGGETVWGVAAAFKKA